MRGERCQPCPCPSVAKNFASTCSRSPGGRFNCRCKPGYAGAKCDRCEEGFYGRPNAPGGSCQPCACNEWGSKSTFTCDQLTGQCRCMPGVTGRDCSQCEARHVLTRSKTCQNCDNFCTGTLLNELQAIQRDLETKYPLGFALDPVAYLLRFKRMRLEVVKEINYLEQDKGNLTFLESSLNIAKPRAYVHLLETIKQSKAGSDLEQDGKQLFRDARLARSQLKALASEIEG